MRQRSSTTASTCRTLTENRWDSTKAKVTNSRIASSVNGMTSRRTRVSVCKESAEASRPFRYCARREVSNPLRVDASTVTWRVIQGVKPPPPPAHYGSREGFINVTFFTNANSGMEVLKCALPPNILQQEGIPLNKVWLRVASPYMRPFIRATSSHMGGRSTSPATPHANPKWISKSATTFPEDAVGEGKSRDTPTIAVTNPCSVAEKAQTAALEILSAANP